MKYGTIYADPPWEYDTKKPISTTRPMLARGENPMAVSHYYDTMTLAAIKALPVRDQSAKDSCLFLWATVPLLPQAFEVMDAWGFDYRTMLTWHKTNGKGAGYWFRGVTEHLLFGTRGNLRSFRSLQKNLIASKVGRHSAKPEQFLHIIEQTSPAPRLEMFARLKRPGWDVFGNQVEHDLLSAA